MEESLNKEIEQKGAPSENSSEERKIQKEPAMTGSLAMVKLPVDVPDPFLLNGATLAYIGDAVYELLVRQYRLSRGSHAADKLHKAAVRMVNAGAQSDMIRALMTELTETEVSIFKRGRNASTMTAARHQSVTDYRRATGLEALFGYLFLSGQHERMQELFLHGADLLEEQESAGR